ncbi:MAG: sigma-70 family RNA polymerase sigma factor [bacterium]
MKSAETCSDEELMASVLAGDIAAFDHLVLRYKERLYGVIYNMTSNHEDTNDLLMESFDKAFRSLPSFKGQASFYTWIYRIAMNRALNLLQKRKKNKNDFSLNDIQLEDAIQKEFLDASSLVDPERQTELKELQIKLNESLQKLSDEHRAVVILYDIEGLSHGDIGRIMNCSEGTVRSRLHYAHKQLQKGLASYLK